MTPQYGREPCCGSCLVDAGTEHGGARLGRPSAAESLTEGASEETKARYAFVFGDVRRLHRMGLIACHYRAAEWGHKQIELAAHDLLQHLDRSRT